MSEIVEIETGQQAAEEAPVVPVELLNDDQRIAFTLVQEFCDASGLGAHAVVRTIQKPYISIEILGGDVRMTLGKYGQGLDALQFIFNTVIPRRVASEYACCSMPKATADVAQTHFAKGLWILQKR